MKTLHKSALLVFISLTVWSCNNQPWEFDDYDYSTTYFPYQFPVRTIVQGEDLFDNSNDAEGRFIVSILVGGMYQNTEGYMAEFEIDESLLDSLKTPEGELLRVLPSEYYSLEPSSEVEIPTGAFKGEIEVSLTQAFFEDSLSTGLNYVLPLKLLSATTDSILSGKAGYPDPDPRKAEDWIIVPKDFTLFAVKYINPYHGNYLHRGYSLIKDSGGSPVDTVIYSERYTVDNEIWKLQTIDLKTVRVQAPLKRSAGSPGDLIMDIEFSEDGSCVISEASESVFQVSGSGKWIEDGDEWGGEARNAIFIEYEVLEGAETHHINDTLVIRDRGVSLETFEPLF